MRLNLILTILTLSFLVSCTTTKKTEVPAPVETPPITQPEPITEIEIKPGNYILSWNKTAPKGQEATRRAWTDKLMAEVNEHFQDLNKATDLKPFCPKYYELPRALQEEFWGELFTRVAYKESSFNPNTVYHESFGVDSIGLYQLSYEDKPNYPSVCPWTSLKDALQNIQCGVGVAAKWVGRDALISQGTSSKTAKGMARYWSTMRSNSSAYSYIRGFTAKLPYCN